MTEALKIKTVFIAVQYSLYTYRGEDGDYSFLADCIIAETEDGRQFALPSHRSYTEAEHRAYRAEYEGEFLFGYATIYDRLRAATLRDEIELRGVIRPEFWVELDVDTRSLEQRWHDEWEREEYERRYGIAA